MAVDPTAPPYGENLPAKNLDRRKLRERDRKQRLRELVDVNRALSLLHRLAYEETWIQHSPVLGPDGLPVRDDSGRPVTVEVNRVAEYNGKANIALKLLNKRIPDLKAVEVEGNVNLRGFMVNMLGVPASPTEPAQARVLDAIYEFVEDDDEEACQALEEAQDAAQAPAVVPSAAPEPVAAPEASPEPAEAVNGTTRRLRYRRR